jgi:hypothetical protein
MGAAGAYEGMEVRGGGMKIYRTERDGIEVLRIAGVIDSVDAEMLAGHIRTADRPNGCRILDFAGVSHADYRVFQVFERLIGKSPGVIFSGFNDYLLSIFAFVSSKKMAPVFSDWRTAFRYLRAERGKYGLYAAARRTAGGGPPEVDGR